MEENNIIEWNPNSMLEVTLNEPDDFLKVRNINKNWCSISQGQQTLSIMSYTS